MSCIWSTDTCMMNILNIINFPKWNELKVTLAFVSNWLEYMHEVLVAFRSFLYPRKCVGKGITHYLSNQCEKQCQKKNQTTIQHVKLKPRPLYSSSIPTSRLHTIDRIDLAAMEKKVGPLPSHVYFNKGL